MNRTRILAECVLLHLREEEEESTVFLSMVTGKAKAYNSPTSICLEADGRQVRRAEAGSRREGAE